MENKRQNLMIAQAKKVINRIKSNDINGIVAELLNNYYYFNEPKYFYNVFGLQGGTIWQLAGYIKANKEKLNIKY